MHDLAGRGVGLRVLAVEGANIDTAAPNDRLMFGVFAALAEFERELVVERTKAGLTVARARGRRGGRPFKMTVAKLRLAQAAMAQRETGVGELCAELGISRQTLYRYMDPARPAPAGWREAAAPPAYGAGTASAGGYGRNRSR